MKTLLLLLLLAGCAHEPVYTPVEVDMPVPVMAEAPQIPAPPDYMGALPDDASLVEGMKACLAQVYLDKGHMNELAARICGR